MLPHTPPPQILAALLRGGPTPRLILFYIAVFTVPGVHLPFWPVWLKAQGLEPTSIGLMLAAAVWIRIIANPLFGHLADAGGGRKGLMLLLAITSICMFSLFGVVDGFWGLLLVSIAFGFVWAPIITLGENLTMLVSYSRELDYGRIRLWGSLSCMVTAATAGMLLESRSPALIFWLVLAGIMLSALACIGLPNVQPPPPAAGADRPRNPLRTLMASPMFVLFISSTAFAQSSHSVLYAFGTLHWRALGLGDDFIGILWAEGVIAEVILFAFGATILRRMSPLNLLMLGTIAGLVRWTATALTGDPLILLALQLLHAFTFGAAHLGAMHFLAQNVRPHLSASAQSLMAMSNGGIALGFGMFAAGPLYAAMAGHAFFVMTGLSLMGLAGTLILAAIRKEEPIG